MKKILLILIILFLSTINAQWEKVNDHNPGAATKMLTHNGSVYLYGDNGPYFIYKSDDEGATWTDVADMSLAEYFELYSFNGKLYANYFEEVHISTDGTSWSLLSTLTLNGGALRGFTNDGNILYAYSNREIIFKSTDNGSSWTEISIKEPAELQIIDFAAIGNIFVVITSEGAFVSKDSGETFVLNNPQTAISGVHHFNGELYGFSFGNGLYKYDQQSDQWVNKSIGLPSDGVLVIPDHMVNVGNTIFLSYRPLLGASGVAMSADFAESWSLIAPEGLPTQNGNNSIAATNSNLFNFYYGVFDPENTGTYRTPIVVSSVENKEEGLPAGFSLSQNYPNPFNPTTKIKYTLPELAGQQIVKLRVFNLLGQEVVNLVNTTQAAGEYEVNFDASSLPSGIYFYTLNYGSFNQTRKLILMK